MFLIKKKEFDTVFQFISHSESKLDKLRKKNLLKLIKSYKGKKRRILFRFLAEDTSKSKRLKIDFYKRNPVYYPFNKALKYDIGYPVLFKFRNRFNLYKFLNLRFALKIRYYRKNRNRILNFNFCNSYLRLRLFKRSYFIYLRKLYYYPFSVKSRLYLPYYDKSRISLLRYKRNYTRFFIKKLKQDYLKKGLIRSFRIYREISLTSVLFIFLRRIIFKRFKYRYDLKKNIFFYLRRLRFNKRFKFYRYVWDKVSFRKNIKYLCKKYKKANYRLNRKKHFRLKKYIYLKNNLVSYYNNLKKLFFLEHIFGKKKYLNRNNNIIVKYLYLSNKKTTDLNKNLSFFDFKLNDQIKFSETHRKYYNLLKYIKRNRRRKYIFNAYSKSFFFVKKYNLFENVHKFYKKNLDLKEFYSDISQPYKFGKIIIVVRKNNMFFSLLNKNNKLLYKVSGGSLKFLGSKKKTNYCREKLMYNVSSHAYSLNYKVIDIYCKFLSKKINFALKKALVESDINVRFCYVNPSVAHGFMRNKKLRRK